MVCVCVCVCVCVYVCIRAWCWMVWYQILRVDLSTRTVIIVTCARNKVSSLAVRDGWTRCGRQCTQGCSLLPDGVSVDSRRYQRSACVGAHSGSARWRVSAWCHLAMQVGDACSRHGSSRHVTLRFLFVLFDMSWFQGIRVSILQLPLYFRFM